MEDFDVVVVDGDDPPAARERAVRAGQLRARRRAHRGAGPPRVAGDHGLGSHPPDHAADRLRQGGHRGGPAGAAPAPRARRSWRRTGGPLIYALEERDRKAVFFGFDLFRTDFPLRVAFPLMLSKSLRWLHPAGLDQTSLQLATGQPILLPVEHGVTSATVKTPSGRAVQAQVTRGLASYTETDEVGVYRVTTSRGETRVAVNLIGTARNRISPPGPCPPSSKARGPRWRPCPCSVSSGRTLCCFALAVLRAGGPPVLAASNRGAAGACRSLRASAGRWACAACCWRCWWWPSRGPPCPGGWTG